MTNDLHIYNNSSFDKYFDYVTDDVILKVEEESEFVLSFTEPGSGEAYQDITWYKDGIDNTDYRIVFLRPTVNNGDPYYYNDYCSGSSPCDSSSKGKLNVDTGDFTVYKAALPDAGFYYYDFFINGGAPNTGDKYQICLDVYGKFYKFELQNCCNK